MKRTGVVVALVGLWPGVVCGEMVTRRWGTPPRGKPAAKAAAPRAKPPTAYVPRAQSPPRLDGKLDDAAWKASAVYRLGRTLDGSGAAPQPTEVRLLRDANHLYLAFRCAEPLLDRLVTSRRAHDASVWEDDSIELFVGPAGGGYFHFGVNALGSTYDARGKDRSWNASFRAAAGREPAAWTVEIALPLKAMAGEGKVPDAWVANFNRNRRTTGRWQETAWSPTYSGDSHVPGRFGRLRFGKPPAGTPGEGRKTPAVKKEDVEVLPVEGGAGIVRFHVTGLPRGVTVYRADLLVFRTVKVDGRMDEARIDIEIYPRLGEKAPAPLTLRPPWYDRFDATEAVRRWAAEQDRPLEFLVKTCPFWNAAATCLDVAYEGKPRPGGPRASKLRAFHRAGQTFLTWQEIEDPVGRDTIAWGPLQGVLDRLDTDRRVRYCVYRHTGRITPANLNEAELIARVRPLSCWNVEGRNVDRPVDAFLASDRVLPTGHWDPFRNATPDGQYGRDCPVERFVIREGDPPLPRGRGLYVHTARAKQRAYYAVIASVDGVQSTGAVAPDNALADPVAESPAEPEPVLQRVLEEMPFFHYDQTRLHYVRWVAPPLANVPMQVHNWSVGVPNPLPAPAPVELNLHRDGHSYWRTQYRLERDSLVLCPHDFPVKSWWHGYHESLGTLRSFRGGRVRPYTERRLLSFLRWACGKWPVDRDRVLVTGCRGGASGSGALRLGLRHPGVFSLVVAGHPIVNYAAASRRTDRHGRADALSMQTVWGKADWDPPGEDGRSFWAAQDLNRFLAALSPAAELPVLALTSNHGDAAFRRLYETLLTQRRALLAEFSWGGTRYVPVSRTQTMPNVIRLDVSRGRPHLACVSPEGLARVRDGKMGDLNLQFRWRGAADTATRFEATIFLAGRGEAVADVTPRNLGRLRPAEGTPYAWRSVSTDGKTEHQRGEAIADAAGLLTLRSVHFAPEPRRLIVEKR